jgi:Cu-Zn family superoxide dismutase
MRTGLKIIIVLIGLLGVASAEEIITVEMKVALESGAGATLGFIKAVQTPFGVLLTPDLAGLTPGIHGFHVHLNPDCSPKEQEGKKVPALAAGGHYDPGNTGRHEGPYGNGHLGDLPALYVGMDGKASYPVLAPRLKLADIKGRSLMIHAGGDNHADHPQKLGGGGARIACGVSQ